MATGERAGQYPYSANGSQVVIPLILACYHSDAASVSGGQRYARILVKPTEYYRGIEAAGRAILTEFP